MMRSQEIPVPEGFSEVSRSKPPTTPRLKIQMALETGEGRDALPLLAFAVVPVQIVPEQKWIKTLEPGGGHFISSRLLLMLGSD